jgi:hypothetical protein
MHEYRVEWSITLDAEDAKDALRQALGDLETALKFKEGATCFFVSDAYGEDKVRFDIEIDELSEIDDPEVPSGGPD